MTKLEKLYESLEKASLLVSKARRSPIRSRLEELMYQVAEQIAVRIAPKTMSDVRAYNTLPYDKVRSALIGQVLEQLPDEYDPDLFVFDVLARIPLNEVCAAPVETYIELASWLIEEGERRAVFAGDGSK